MFNRLQAIRKSGFNLIEAAIVLGVVGLVVGGIWSAASSVIENRRISKFTEDILLINQCIKNKFPRLQCDSILCANGGVIDWWNQTKFFDDIGCIPQSIERRPSGAQPRYYDALGNDFFVVLKPSGNISILWGLYLIRNITVSECSKLANRIAISAKRNELEWIEIGPHIHTNYAALSITDWANFCQNDGSGMGVQFKP